VFSTDPHIIRGVNKALPHVFLHSTQSLEPKTFSMKTYFTFTPQRGNKQKHASGLFFRHVLCTAKNTTICFLGTLNQKGNVTYSHADEK
jgi:hypothetical protein